MKRLVFGVAFLLLAGCSANSLQKAETNTRLAGAVPGGGIIYLPIWAASTIANAGHGSSDQRPQEVIAVTPDADEQKRIEEYRRKNHLD